MEKTRLSLDDLEIQSFATTTPPAGRRGTVRGHDDAPTDEVECPTVNAGWDTCWDTCRYGCGQEGNTGDCTVICETDACGNWSRGSWYATYC
jgi:hypothetical protein